jgi:1-acyl-sn-glycerol-3-phosphate acyltransferase
MKDGVNRVASGARSRSQEIASGARTRGQELATGARARGQEIARNAARLDVPWARCDFARMVREVILSAGFGPLMSLYTRRRAVGREVLDDVEPPVLFVANHSSHMDTPMILRMLPARWRQKVAVAAAADYFYRKRWMAHGVSLMFNTVPMARNGGGMTDGATRHVDRLLEDRWSLIVYPEGTRSQDGRIGRLRTGVAVLAAEHDIPIVPIYITGTSLAMPKGLSWPKLRLFRRRYRVTLTFGEPIRPRPGEHRTELMERVREFYEAQGAPTTPGKIVRREADEPAVAARAVDEAAEPAPLTPAA